VVCKKNIVEWHKQVLPPKLQARHFQCNPGEHKVNPENKNGKCKFLAERISLQENRLRRHESMGTYM